MKRFLLVLLFITTGLMANDAVNTQKDKIVKLKELEWLLKKHNRIYPLDEDKRNIENISNIINEEMRLLRNMTLKDKTVELIN